MNGLVTARSALCPQAGQIAVGGNITVKLVRALDGVVMSATNFMVDRKLVIRIINQ
jgi:hypothetical protein